VIAEKLRLPAIMPLLLIGMAAGPYGLAVLHPEALGQGLEVFIHLGVAIILFEGGLSLDPGQLRRVGGPVRNLLSVGVAVTWVGAAWLAHVTTGLAWSIAWLFGAVVTVTGPTVIVPLLRHMIAPRKVRTVLVSEGLIVDPIGAVLAYLVLQWIERAGRPIEPLARELGLLCVAGAVIGFVAASLARAAARSRLFAGELRNLAILALLLACFMVSEWAAPQSGVLAAVVMGFTMSAADIPDLGSVKVFKGQLTLLLISVLFILLSAQLDLATMMALGWRGLVVALGLTLLVRPVAVSLSIWPGQMDLRSRVMLGLIAPRGIVAAAVASLSAIGLREAGMAEGAAQLEGLVYLAILVTGAWATAMALVLPRLLDFQADPSRRLTVLVGAHALSEALAAKLEQRGRKAVVIDTSGFKLERLRRRGIATVRGDARDAATYEAAGLERDSDVLALTTNDELNLLIAELVREEFGVGHPVVALQRPSDEFGKLRRAWIDPLGGHSVDLPRWLRWLESDRAAAIDLEIGDEDDAQELARLVAERKEDVVYVCGWTGDQPSFRPRLDDLGKRDRATVLAVKGPATEELARWIDEPAADPGVAWEGPLPGEGGEAEGPQVGAAPATATEPEG
jgi:NhaP-type Na+/H+ or K+/H+ antiporter